MILDFRLKDSFRWPRLWRSWQSGRFQHQRSVVRIPTSAMINLYWNVIICKLQPRKGENKEKEAGNGPFIKNGQFRLLFKMAQNCYCKYQLIFLEQFFLGMIGNYHQMLDLLETSI